MSVFKNRDKKMDLSSSEDSRKWRQWQVDNGFKKIKDKSLGGDLDFQIGMSQILQKYLRYSKWLCLKIFSFHSINLIAGIIGKSFAVFGFKSYFQKPKSNASQLFTYHSIYYVFASMLPSGDYYGDLSMVLKAP